MSRTYSNPSSRPGSIGGRSFSKPDDRYPDREYETEGNLWDDPRENSGSFDASGVFQLNHQNVGSSFTLFSNPYSFWSQLPIMEK